MNQIKQIRKSLGLSVTELAARLNMSQGNLTKIENNQIDLKTETAQKIAAVLGCPLEKLLAEAPELPSSLSLPFNLPPQSHTLSVRDDTMAPTLQPGDLAVYMPENAKRENGLYVLEQQGREVIRRLQGLTDGTIAVLCDNPAYQAEYAAPGTLTILGRMTHKITLQRL